MRAAICHGFTFRSPRMNAIDWKKAKEIFGELLLVPPAERLPALALACGGDAALRAQVENLLKSHEELGAFLETPVIALLTEAFDEDAAETKADALIGQFVGTYQIVREIGRGGMGRVYLAERADGHFRKRVAVKVMRGSADEQMLNRFRRERQILADLNHPNVAHLLDGGDLDGAPYIVMEYVEGETLREVLKRRGALPTEEVLDITGQIAAGLEAAHQLDIIHRDIKPENIILSHKGRSLSVKILDFGVARPSDLDTGEMNTQAGAVVGTARYMSPEQAAGDSGALIDQRLDIYSLAAVVYEMLTGAPVFVGSSYLSLINQHLNATPRSPLEIRPDLPPAMGHVVLKALAKKREARPQSASEFFEALRRAQQDPAQTIPNSGYETVAERAPHPFRKITPSRKILPALSIIATVALLGLYWKGRGLIGPGPKHASAPSSPAAMASPMPRLGFEYQVIKRTPDGKTETLLTEKDAVANGDQVYFRITLPFDGECYLFYEIPEDDSTPASEHELIWVNPLNNLTPQRGTASDMLRLPAEGAIPFDTEPGKQRYTVLFIPKSVSWSLNDLIPKERLALHRDEDPTLSHVHIAEPDLTKLLQLLENNKIDIDIGAPKNGIYTARLPSETRADRPTSFYIVIWQAQPR